MAGPSLNVDINVDDFSDLLDFDKIVREEVRKLNLENVESVNVEDNSIVKKAQTHLIQKNNRNSTVRQWSSLTAAAGAAGAAAADGGRNRGRSRVSIFWEYSQTGLKGNGGWKLSGTQEIRFNFENSANCGGNNDLVQSGTATAKINVYYNNASMNVYLEGIGESESASFELMFIKLDDNDIIRGNAPGGGLKCAMGASVITTLVNGPYILEPGEHTLTLDTTTNDPLFHFNAYYLCRLSFS